MLGFEAHVDAGVVTDRPHSGASCLRVDGAPDHNCFAQQSVAVQGGREYDFAVWVRSQDVPEGADCKAHWNVWAGDTLLESTAMLPRTQGTTGWTRQSVRFRAPEAATKISIILQLYKAIGTVWLDDLSLVVVATEGERSRAAAQAAEQQRAVDLGKSAPEVAPGVRFAAATPATTAWPRHRCGSTTTCSGPPGSSGTRAEARAPLTAPPLRKAGS